MPSPRIQDVICMILYSKQHTFREFGYMWASIQDMQPFLKPLPRNTSEYAAFVVDRRGCIFSMKAAIYALTKQAVLHTASCFQNTPALSSSYKTFMICSWRRDESLSAAVQSLYNTTGPYTIRSPILQPALHAAPRSAHSFQDASPSLAFARQSPQLLFHLNIWRIESSNTP